MHLDLPGQLWKAGEGCGQFSIPVPLRIPALHLLHNNPPQSWERLTEHEHNMLREDIRVGSWCRSQLPPAQRQFPDLLPILSHHSSSPHTSFHANSQHPCPCPCLSWSSTVYSWQCVTYAIRKVQICSKLTWLLVFHVQANRLGVRKE